MNLIHYEHKYLHGITIRTWNEDKKNQKTAKFLNLCPNLWTLFHTKIYQKSLHNIMDYEVHDPQ